VISEDNEDVAVDGEKVNSPGPGSFNSFQVVQNCIRPRYRDMASNLYITAGYIGNPVVETVVHLFRADDKSPGELPCTGARNVTSRQI
jgi:hypothetical protein